MDGSDDLFVLKMGDWAIQIMTTLHIHPAVAIATWKNPTQMLSIPVNTSHLYRILQYQFLVSHNDFK